MAADARQHDPRHFFAHTTSMIKLSRLTDYAVVILTQMVGDEKNIWSAADLAERTHLPLPTISKILKKLTKSAIVSTRRGALGGHRLNHAAASISILSIVEAMDGPIAITNCADGSRQSCKIANHCSMNHRWNKINFVMRRALEEVSLADVTVSQQDFLTPIDELAQMPAQGTGE